MDLATKPQISEIEDSDLDLVGDLADPELAIL
jgi:hypothetical protein